MTEKSIEEIVVDIQAGRNRKENYSLLWERVRPFVAKTAARYGAENETDDLIQEGFIGIMGAAQKFDAARGVKFLTFAEWAIKSRMTRYMEYSGTVRLPAHKAEAARQYKKAVSEFEKANGRPPSDLETAFLLGIHVDRRGQWRRKVDGIKSAARDVVSLSAPIDEDGKTLEDLKDTAAPEDTESMVLDSVLMEQLRAVIWEQVDSLPELEARVIRERYGEGLQMAEIGERHGITRNAAYTAEGRALHALRTGKRGRALEPFRAELYGSAMQGTGAGSFSRTWTSATEREALRLLDRARWGHGGSGTDSGMI